MKRIYKPACPAANNAVRHAGIMNRYGSVYLFVAFFSGNRRMICRRKDPASRRVVGGTLIHNGNRSPSLSIGFLAVPLVKPPFESLSVTKVCSAPLFPASFLAAAIAAVLMPPVTAAANPKYRSALMPSANPLTQNIFSSVSHLHLKARLDNGRRSCQLSDGCINKPPMHEVLPLGPDRWHDRGLFHSTFRKRLHDDDEGFHAFGVDDVVLVNSGGCLKNYVF